VPGNTVLVLLFPENTAEVVKVSVLDGPAAV
jgi:hypothetical protein